MANIVLKWKEHSVNLNKVDQELKSMIGADYFGTSAVGPDSLTHEEGLHVHLADSVSEEQKEEIQTYWDAIDEESQEAVSYKSKDDIAAEKAALKASGRAKLIALGLTEQEADAWAK